MARKPQVLHVPRVLQVPTPMETCRLPSRDVALMWKPR